MRATVAARAVEPGVTGKEKTFQQNRAFGPGAMKPYPSGGTSGPGRTVGNDGVYNGGAKARSIPAGPAPIRPETHRGERTSTGRGPAFRKPNGPGEQTV
jgi:hypothetical protein